MHGNLRLGLFVLRISIFVFFAIWVGEKFFNPEMTIAIYAHFYFLDGVPVWGAYVTGIVQGVILLGFLFGALKFWSYGALLAMHTFSTLSSWQQIITPYESNHHLFVAAIPVWGALLFLFLMRDEDSMLNPFSRSEIS